MIDAAILSPWVSNAKWPKSSNGFNGFPPWQAGKNSGATAHQVREGDGCHAGVCVGDKNSQAGGGLINYFGDQTAEQ
jgi:hypothetical protein